MAVHYTAEGSEQQAFRISILLRYVLIWQIYIKIKKSYPSAIFVSIAYPCTRDEGSQVQLCVPSINVRSTFDPDKCRRAQNNGEDGSVRPINTETMCSRIIPGISTYRLRNSIISNKRQRVEIHSAGCPSNDPNTSATPTKGEHVRRIRGDRHPTSG